MYNMSYCIYNKRGKRGLHLSMNRFRQLNHSIVQELCVIVQELCESRGGRPGLSVLTSLLVSVDVKNY